MKYFIDFEFIEGFKAPTLYPLLGKRRHFIDMISVGIVCEDGREYYAISKEFNPKDANDWVKRNVLSKLPSKYLSSHGNSPTQIQNALLWKYNNLIRYEILDFFDCEMNNGIWNEPHKWTAPKGIEVYGYYADYDWVVLCSLFGRMMDLPENFPMYCKDLKQMLDEKDAYRLAHTTEINGGTISLENHDSYPKQDNEHNALADAKWNKKLYDFLDGQ